MSFNRIYGYGTNIKEAFIDTKINEIGFLSSQTLKREKELRRFLKKTKVKYVDYDNPKKLETELFIVHDLERIKRELTAYERKCLIKLRKYFGIQKFNEILKIYRNKEGNSVIGFKVDKRGKINKYKFLF